MLLLNFAALAACSLASGTKLNNYSIANNNLLQNYTSLQDCLSSIDLDIYLEKTGGKVIIQLKNSNSSYDFHDFYKCVNDYSLGVVLQHNISYTELPLNTSNQIYYMETAGVRSGTC